MNEWNNSTICSSVAEKTPSVFHMSISTSCLCHLYFMNSLLRLLSLSEKVRNSLSKSSPTSGMSVRSPLLLYFPQLLHLAYLADVKRVNKVHIHVYSQCLHIKIKFLGTIRWMKESFLWFSGQRCSHHYWAARARLHTSCFQLIEQLE